MALSPFHMMATSPAGVPNVNVYMSSYSAVPCRVWQTFVEVLPAYRFVWLQKKCCPTPCACCAAGGGEADGEAYPAPGAR